MFIPMSEIERFISEAVPYFDLTSTILGIGEQMGEIAYFTRQDAVVCGTEEVDLIFKRFNIQTNNFMPTGGVAKAGDVLISGVGRAGALNMAWKAGQNILEHCGGIATKTHEMVKIAKASNPDIAVLTTRKGFPGTKPIAIKAIMAGGAMPHRLGLSETIVIFKQHLEFIGGFDALIEKIPTLKSKICGKKIIVEADNFEQAQKLCAAGVCGIQFDKVEINNLKEMIVRLRMDFPDRLFLATGGINEGNIGHYAATGADGIVTTSPYNAPPIDVGVKIFAIDKVSQI